MKYFYHASLPPSIAIPLKRVHDPKHNAHLGSLYATGVPDEHVIRANQRRTKKCTSAILNLKVETRGASSRVIAARTITEKNNFASGCRNLLSLIHATSPSSIGRARELAILGKYGGSRRCRN